MSIMTNSLADADLNGWSSVMESVEVKGLFFFFKGQG